MKLINYTKALLCDSWSIVRTTTGRVLREAGLDLDIKGAIMQNDIAYLEKLSRHRNIVPIEGRVLQVSPSAYLASNSTIIGGVQIAENSYIGFGCVANGLNNQVRIGANSKIGDNTVLETNFAGNDDAYPLSTTIGNNVSIEHNCHLLSCIVDDDVHIGHRSYIGEGCQLERGCVIAPNSYVPAGSRIPAYTLWAGSPAVYVKEVGAEELKKVGQYQKEQVRIGYL